MAFLADLRYGLRTLRRSPGFTLAAIATLGLGIGAITAIYSVVYGVLLQPLPYPGAKRIVGLNTRFVGSKAREIPRVTGGDVPDLIGQTEVFQSFATYFGGEMGVQVNGHAEFSGLQIVTAPFFEVFRVRPVAGRFFQESEAARAALVSQGFAKRNFGGASEALGKTLNFDNRVFVIVGVMPGEFQFPAKTEVWAGRDPKNDNTSRTAYNYRAVARLRDGVTLEQANARLEALGGRLEAAFPKDNQEKRFSVTELQERMVSPMRSTLLWLQGAVALLLLIACANVANLLLARSAGRSREIAVRAALGASRGRMARQLLTESVLIAGGGAILGVLVSVWGTGLLIGMAPEGVPRLADVRMSLPVLMFCVGIALLSSLIFGLLPAFQSAGVDIVEALKKGARGMTGGSGSRLRNGVVIGEIALSFCLVLGAGVLFRQLVALVTEDLGFRTERLLVMYAHRPANTLEQAKNAARFFDDLYVELNRVPGVQSAGGVMGLPMGRYGSNGLYSVEGKPEVDLKDLPHAVFSLASPRYFESMGIRLIQGRDFTSADQYDSLPTAIISESLANQSFAGEDPIGKRLRCGLDEESGRWMTIVGVVSDVRADSPSKKPGPNLYMPLTQHPWRANEVQVILRAAISPEALTGTVRGLVARRDPNVAVQFTTMEQTISDSIATPRFRAYLTGAFAWCALLLAMAGVYSVVNYLATRRVPEFGLRLSLGASGGSIARIVLSRALSLALVGLCLGALLAFAAYRLAGSLIAGIEPVDSLSAFGALGAMLATTLCAAAIPAWRAARVNPVDALRSE